MKFWTHIALIAAASIGACDPSYSPERARTEWLAERLWEDNLIWWSRDPGLLDQKYEEMARDPYDFMRATAGVYYRDQIRPGTLRPHMPALLTNPSTEVLLIADPHMENFGTYKSSRVENAATYEPNDFDGTGFGPFFWDLRRANVGWGILLTQSEACDEACRSEAFRALVGGYVSEIADRHEGQEGVSGLDYAAYGDLLADAGEEAIDEGSRRKKLFKETEEVDGQLRLLRDEDLDSAGEGMLDLTAEEALQVERLMTGLSAALGRPVRQLDAVRRFGSGIASLPAIRYVVLLDEGDPTDVDDRLIQIREVVEPPVIPGMFTPVAQLYPSQGERVQMTAQALWSDRGADDLVAGLTDGAMGFKVGQWSSWNQDFSHTDVAAAVRSGRMSTDDLHLMMSYYGRLIAGAHSRADTLRGEDALPSLAQELDGRETQWLDALAAAAEQDLQSSLRDHQLFLDLYERGVLQTPRADMAYE